MLVKNKNILCDAHFHYLPSIKKGAFNPPSNWKGCSCAHSKEEWLSQEKYKEENPGKLISAFGIHPQQMAESYDFLEGELHFLEKLLQENKIDAIGECGFDFFTEEYKATNKVQEVFFVKQIELAIKYSKPVIIHCRKANEKLFEYDYLLKKCKKVLFHSFMGTLIEAKSLLNHQIKGYFSFGKQIQNNNKKVISCVKDLPLEALLLETDAPFQYLKKQNKTEAFEIEEIYKSAWKLRKEAGHMESFDEFSKQIYKNLICLYYE